MSIFRNISNHSTRGYFALQTLFAASALTLGWSVGSFGDGGALSWALSFCLGVNLTAIMVLIYLQRTISQRLEHASIADEEQARMMRTDALTGAATRSHFLMELQDSLGRPLAPKQATLVLVDIDYFKQLNDSFGHPVGDSVLAHVAEEMQRLFPDGIVGRLGGDEFAILMRDCDIATTTARAHRLAERLRAGIPCDNQTVSLSISIGTALAPLHASQAKELMLLADLALYESKTSGRGRMTVFDDQAAFGQAPSPLRRARAARGNLPQRARTALPAGDRHRRLPVRGRGPGPMAPPGARPDTAERVHPDRRGVDA